MPESQTWTLPAPIRALVWWPPVALLLFVVAPDTAPWAVTLAGAVLAALGAAGAAIARAAARSSIALPVPTAADAAVPELAARQQGAA